MPLPHRSPWLLARPILLVLLAGASGLPLAASGRPGRQVESKSSPAGAMAALLGGLTGLDARTEASRLVKAPFLAADGTLRYTTAVRGRRVGPGADLRGFNLRGADLSRCDLTGADLRGADLTWASLEGAVCTRARLAGACLFQASTQGAVDLDTTGAELHPFFEVAEDEEVGDIKVLDLAWPGHTPRGGPNHPVCGPDGRLFWMEGDDPVVHGIATTGSRFSIEAAHDTRLHAMARNSDHWLWTIGNRMICAFDLRHLCQATTHRQPECHYTMIDLAQPPSQVTAGPSGDLWLSLRTRALRLMPITRDDRLDTRVFDFTGHFPAGSRVALSRDRDCLAFAAPGQSLVTIHQVESKAIYAVPFHKDFRPRRIAMGHDDRLWLTMGAPEGASGEAARGWREGIGVIDPRGEDSQVHPLPDPGPTPAEPYAIAPGADGAMWFTERLAGRIGRISGKGAITHYPLPEGMRPLDLVPSEDGRMLFTLEGRQAIGSIRVELRPPTRPAEPKDRMADEAIRDTPPAAAARPAASAAPSAPEAGESKAATRPRAPGWKAFQARLQRAEARFQARMAAETPESGAGEGTSGTKAGPDGTKVPSGAADPGDAKAAMGTAGPGDSGAAQASAGATPLTDLERIEAQGVLLASGATRHILRRHGSAAPVDRSRFHPDFQSAAALERLLADGLERADAIGRIRKRRPERAGPGGRIDGVGRGLRLLDLEGSYRTYCAASRPIGWNCDSEGRVEATRTFVVVTRKVQDEDGAFWHDVLTAHPVAERTAW